MFINIYVKKKEREREKFSSNPAFLCLIPVDIVAEESIAHIAIKTPIVHAPKRSN